MATIQAFIRVSKKKIDKSNVRFRLRDGRLVDLYHVSEIEVDPNHWDTKRQTIKPQVVIDENKRLEINKAVSDRKGVIEKAYSQAISKEGLTSEWLESEIDKILHPSKYGLDEQNTFSVFEYIERFIELAPNRKSASTGRLLTHNNIQQYKATQKHLLAFAKEEKVNDFDFEDLDREFYDRFLEYLQSEIEETDSKGNVILDSEGNPRILKASFTANSVGKHIRILKLILNEATREGVNTSTNYNTFRVISEETDSIYLDERELQLLKDLDLSRMSYLDKVRDWFLLLAWTGSRFSDLEKVTKSNIKDNFITFRQQKTNTKVTIPLHPIVIEIFEKYDFNLPEPISNQKFNEYIKEVGSKAGITSNESISKTIGGKLQTETIPKYKLISSHTGRRSFCTNMYKRGLPTLSIMSISGHKTEKSFLKYIKVKQEEHAEMMAKAWAKMYQ